MNIFGGNKKITKQDALKWGTYGITGLILFGKATLRFLCTASLKSISKYFTIIL